MKESLALKTSHKADILHISWPPPAVFPGKENDPQKDPQLVENVHHKKSHSQGGGGGTASLKVGT